MIALLSPAKSQDFDRKPITSKHTKPEFLKHAAELVGILKTFDASDIVRIMNVSNDIARLNVERFNRWTEAHEGLDNGLQAIFAYTGEVYRGFDADSLRAEDIYYAQNHIRILSGLYGVLRPLDLIRPYRLEMATRLETEQGEPLVGDNGSLYEFWADAPRNHITDALQGHRDPSVIDLASKEYSKAVDLTTSDVPVITPSFKEKRGDSYRIIASYAKHARGAMARYMVENRIEDRHGLKNFSENGYRYSPELSGEQEWVFVR